MKTERLRWSAWWKSVTQPENGKFLHLVDFGLAFLFILITYDSPPSLLSATSRGFWRMDRHANKKHIFYSTFTSSYWDANSSHDANLNKWQQQKKLNLFCLFLSFYSESVPRLIGSLMFSKFFLFCFWLWELLGPTGSTTTPLKTVWNETVSLVSTVNHQQKNEVGFYPKCSINAHSRVRVNRPLWVSNVTFTDVNRQKRGGESATFSVGDFRDSVGVLGLWGWATRAWAGPPSSTYTNTGPDRPLTHLASISIVHTPAIPSWLPTNSITSAEADPKGRLCFRLTPFQEPPWTFSR